MLKCIIIDDEPLAIELLTDYVNKADFLVFEKSFSDPIKAMQYLNEHEIDLVFLDIQMPELTGIQFMKILHNKTNFILTTAYDQYAMEGYEYDVIDYLLKPITIDRFMIAANKAKERLLEGSAASDSIVVAQVDTPDYIFVKSEYKVQKINLNDISYLESMGDYVMITLEEGKVMSLETMKSFEERLPKSKFMRVHRSYIIPIDKIEYIERNRIKIKEKLIPVSNSYQKEFWERIDA